MNGRHRRILQRGAIVASAIAAPTTVLAAPSAADPANTAWVLIATALVMFMTAPALALCIDQQQ